MTAHRIPTDLSGYPIGDNTAAFETFAAGNRETELTTIRGFLDEGLGWSADAMGDDLVEAYGLDDQQREDLLFAWGYLRGLADAWNATALEVYEAWLAWVDESTGALNRKDRPLVARSVEQAEMSLTEWQVARVQVCREEWPEGTRLDDDIIAPFAWRWFDRMGREVAFWIPTTGTGLAFAKPREWDLSMAASLTPVRVDAVWLRS